MTIQFEISKSCQSLAAPNLTGPRVRIQEGGSSSSSCSRGWQTLRNQWRDFVIRRGEVPDRVLADLEETPPPQRPTSLNLSKDGFDRMLDKILASHTSNSPRTKARAAIWQKAAQANSDLRATLGDPWLHAREDADRSTPPPPADDPAMAFFPTDWANCLSDDTLAELIVDAYSSAFCDAFLDSAVSLVEVSNKWNAVQSGTLAGLGQSMSESSLSAPKANRRLRNTSHTDATLLQMGLLDQDPAAATDGFTMSGLSKDPWEAWNSRNFHKSKPLDSFVKRIETATQAQRPQRRIVKKLPKHIDNRKYLEPMAATNFPEAWNKQHSPLRRTSVDYAAEDDEFDDDDVECATDSKWLIKVGRDGKTRIPYSLVSHRAFLDAQPNAILKEKARKIAPLKLSHSSSEL